MRRVAVLAGVGLVLVAAGTVAAARLQGSPTDPHALPLGDGKVSLTGPESGDVYACRAGPAGGGGAQVDGPWIHGSTFDLTAKATVAGSVTWPQAHVSFTRVGGRLRISGDALPKGAATGVFPIQPGTAAYQYDRNPNAIAEQAISWTLPAAKVAARASCLTGGPIGIAVNGVPIFDALDAEDRDAVAHEVQDACSGHPQQQGLYHYHDIPSCLLHGDDPTKASPLVGYALDGFPIYGPRGPGGRLYTDADLDACHGHTVVTKVHGKSVASYRYQATLEYPYTLGCFHGTPLRLAPPG